MRNTGCLQRQPFCYVVSCGTTIIFCCVAHCIVRNSIVQFGEWSMVNSEMKIFVIQPVERLSYDSATLLPQTDCCAETVTCTLQTVAVRSCHSHSQTDRCAEAVTLSPAEGSQRWPYRIKQQLLFCIQ